VEKQTSSIDLVADPQTDVAPGWTRGRHVRSRYRCSMCSAIHINSRSWLRSSSTHEPSDPPPKVVFGFFFRPRRSCPTAVRKSEKMHNAFKMKKCNVRTRGGRRERVGLFEPRGLLWKLELPPHPSRDETQVPLDRHFRDKAGRSPGPAKHRTEPLFEPSATRRARSQL
jgi:hypothetical protein